MSSKTKTTATKEEATPALVPKLRFPEFRGTEAWHVTTLDSVCEVLNNRRKPITGNDRTPGSYPYYGASGIVDYVGDFIFDERLLLVGEDGAKWGAFEKTAFIAEGKYWVNNHAHVLKPFAASDTLLENYLTMQDLSPFVTGAAPPKLTLGKLKGIPVPLPPKPAEQQKIAECLSSVDELIAAQARKLNALKTHKKGLMQQLFPREGETQPRLRFPEFQNAGEWGVKPLGRAAENLDNRRRPITSSDREAGNVPYYGASGIVDYVEGFIFDEDLLCVSEDGANLMARTYPIAFPISGKTWVNNHAHVLRFANPCTQKFAEVYLNSIKLDDFITGMAQPKLNKAMLDEIPIPYPGIPEQQRIADCLTSLDDLIVAQTQKHEALKTHKKGLMQQLFPSPEEGGA
jgi:type I restriction enzyme, S subunit